MFPLRDNVPSPRFPIVVVLLIGLNIAVFGLEWTLPREEAESFLLGYAMIPARDFAGLSLGWSGMQSFVPFFTSIFLHGGLFHILANMWSLWIFGDNIEGRMGPLRFTLFYLACGVIAGAAHAVLNPASTVPVVGASGAISGVMGAYLILFPRARLQMFTILIFYPIFFELPAVVFLVIWFLGQLVSGTANLAVQQAAGVENVGGIAFFAHIGGFLAGLVLMPLFLRRKARRFS